jgi:hypothetical protein
MSKKLTNWKLFSNTDHARSVFKLDLNQLKLYNNHYSLRRKRVCRNDLYHRECGFFNPLPVCFLAL